jgi:hypothetical protein
MMIDAFRALGASMAAQVPHVLEYFAGATATIMCVVGIVSTIRWVFRGLME